MTAILATIYDRNESEVARVEACPEAHRLDIRIVHECQMWREKLAELDKGNLRLMMDSLVYLEKETANGKQLLALDALLKELSDQELHVSYDSTGIERGYQLKREIAKQSDDWVPFTDLLEILRQSSPAS